MKKINIIIAIVLVVGLIAVAYLVTRIVATQSSVPEVDLSTEVGSIEQKRERELIWEYHKQGNKQSVIQAAEKYLKLVPQDEAIWIVLAENYMWSDKLIEAERAIKQALRLNSKSFWGLRVIAAVYRDKAEQSPQTKEEYLSKAQLEIDEALAVAPNDAWVNMEAARVYLAQGKRDKALQFVERAIELEPEEEYLLNLKEQILSGIE
ncbi:MAG: tetratricopeptide repeat protein [Candidatus Omnitrophica bacterium]|nr:tetratricopeptide repeat protein [Candidatus Omnitrophota bacterium]